MHKFLSSLYLAICLSLILTSCEGITHFAEFGGVDQIKINSSSHVPPKSEVITGAHEA